MWRPHAAVSTCRRSLSNAMGEEDSAGKGMRGGGMRITEVVCGMMGGGRKSVLRDG